MRATKQGAKSPPVVGQIDRTQMRFGFPMEFKDYSRYGLSDDEHHGIILSVVFKDKDKKPLLSRNHEPMIRVVVGFRGDTDQGGYVQVDYYAVADGGWWWNFVEFVLPDEFAKILALPDDDTEGYNVREALATGRLIKAVIVNEEYPKGSNEWRPKITQFVAPSASWVKAGPSQKTDPGNNKPSGKPQATNGKPQATPQGSGKPSKAGTAPQPAPSQDNDDPPPADDDIPF